MTPKGLAKFSWGVTALKEPSVSHIWYTQPFLELLLEALLFLRSYDPLIIMISMCKIPQVNQILMGYLLTKYGSYRISVFENVDSQRLVLAISEKRT